MQPNVPENPFRFFNRQAFTGTRGFALTICAVIVASALNFLSRFGLPAFMGFTEARAVYPVLSAIALLSLPGMALISGFIYVHSWIDPPKPGLRDYFPYIALVAVIGFAGSIMD